MSYNFLFREYARKWKVDVDTVRVVFLAVDLMKKYSMVTRALNDFGFKISERQVRYFYKKVMLTDRYGMPDKIGRNNYRRNVVRKS